MVEPPAIVDTNDASSSAPSSLETLQVESRAQGNASPIASEPRNEPKVIPVVASMETQTPVVERKSAGVQTAPLPQPIVEVVKKSKSWRDVIFCV